MIRSMPSVMYSLVWSVCFCHLQQVLSGEWGQQNANYIDCVCVAEGPTKLLAVGLLLRPVTNGYPGFAMPQCCVPIITERV